MNSHMSKEFQDVCQLCIERCQETINDLRELLVECELVNIIAKCEKDLNKSILVCDDCIDLCQKSMDHAQQHIQSCKDKDCEVACNELILACRECIKACDDVELECQHNLEVCIDSSKVCMEKCKAAIVALNKCLKVLKSK